MPFVSRDVYLVTLILSSYHSQSAVSVFRLPKTRTQSHVFSTADEGSKWLSEYVYGKKQIFSDLTEPGYFYF